MEIGQHSKFGEMESAEGMADEDDEFMKMTKGLHISRLVS